MKIFYWKTILARGKTKKEVSPTSSQKLHRFCCSGGLSETILTVQPPLNSEVLKDPSENSIRELVKFNGLN